MNFIQRAFVTQNDVISRHPKSLKSRMKHCNNHLKLLTNIKEIQQKEKEAWMDTNGQDWNGLHLGNLEKNRPDFFQVYGKSPGLRLFLLTFILFVMQR